MWRFSNTEHLRLTIRKHYQRDARDPPMCPPIGQWDVSGVTDMSMMFYELPSFNEDISGWDVSGVTTMAGMFWEANAFNQPIGTWNVSNVTDMQIMFWDAEAFNQPLAGWNVSKVTDMQGMFWGARAFNQSLAGWDVSNVTNMEFMFCETDCFHQPLARWDVSNVTNMREMFRDAHRFDQPLSSWDVSKVRNMHRMFLNATVFGKLHVDYVGGWRLRGDVCLDNLFEGSSFREPLNWREDTRILCGDRRVTVTVAQWNREIMLHRRYVDSCMIEYLEDSFPWDDPLVLELLKPWTMWNPAQRRIETAFSELTRRPVLR